MVSATNAATVLSPHRGCLSRANATAWSHKSAIAPEPTTAARGVSFSSSLRQPGHLTSHTIHPVRFARDAELLLLGRAPHEQDHARFQCRASTERLREAMAKRDEVSPAGDKPEPRFPSEQLFQSLRPSLLGRWGSLRVQTA